VSEFLLDTQRAERIGFGEAVYAGGKTGEQIAAILADAARRGAALFLTRLDPARLAALPCWQREAIDYEEISRTATFGSPCPAMPGLDVAIVTAGTSDVPVAREALRGFRVVIVAAGMDAALPSVIAGLVPGCVIAVPTSVGYGVAAGGRAALDAILASCAPGIVTVNIDNGYGAACAALRVLGAAGSLDRGGDFPRAPRQAG
jgi:NCAIR mutase (PurE)-related protein